MVNDVWVTIPKFPNYEINALIQVRHKRIKQLKRCFMNDGYLRLNIEHWGKSHRPYLHQIVAWAFIPNPESKPEIHHKDGDPLNNHWTNLQWVTRAEHRQLSKENEQTAHKLKRSDVIDIRNNYVPGCESEMAAKYGVLRQTIYCIAIGKNRKCVGGKIHDPKGVIKKIINIKTGEIYDSTDELSLITGVKVKTLRRQLNGERYNNTTYRYLGEEHLSRSKPKSLKSIPLIPYSFGVVVPRKELMRSKNPYAQWKRVIQCDLSGNELAEYKSIREAAREMGANDHKPIQKLLNGRGNSMYRGFKWKYA